MADVSWDRIVHVVVLGSGAARLAASTFAADVGAEVLVLEKADLIGGTGVSGGMPWIPLHAASVAPRPRRRTATETRE